MPTLTGILFNRCAFCGTGKVFSTFLKMNRECPHCHHVFEREPGYFLGSMIASYFIGAFSLVPTVILSVFVFNIEIPTMILIGSLQIVFLTPLLFRYSRLVWIYTDSKMTERLRDEK